MYYAFQDPSFEFQNCWHPNQWKLKIGEEKQVAVLPDKDSLGTEIKKYPVDLYDGKVTIRPDSKRFFMLFDNEKSMKIKRGVQVHAILGIA